MSTKLSSPMNKTILLLAIMLLIAACSKDTIPPEISSINIEMNDTLKNIYPIEFDATDKSGINRVELYLNDSLLTSGESVPFKYEFNTLQYDDGTYKIKVVLYDTEGNKSESVSEVVVSNCLLIINSKSMYNGLYHLIVADEEGNILDTVIFRRNEVRISKPHKPYEGDAINFIWFRTGIFPTISACIHVKRGSEYKLFGYPESEQTKCIRIHFKNDISSFEKIIISTDKSYITLNSLADTINIPQCITYTPGHKLLLRLQTNEGLYYRIVDINEVPDLTDITIDLSSINRINTRKTITMPSSGWSSGLILGKVKESDIYNRYTLFSGNGGMLLDLWYPADYFLKYFTQMSFRAESSNKLYFDEYNGQIPTMFVPLNADFIIINPGAGDFSSSHSGSFDTFYVSYYNAEHTIQLGISATSQIFSWKLPNPGLIFNDSQFNLDLYHPNLISINEHENIVSTNGYYDLSINTELLHTYDPHYQNMQISIQQN